MQLLLFKYFTTNLFQNKSKPLVKNMRRKYSGKSGLTLHACRFLDKSASQYNLGIISINSQDIWKRVVCLASIDISPSNISTKQTPRLVGKILGINSINGSILICLRNLCLTLQPVHSKIDKIL